MYIRRISLLAKMTECRLVSWWKGPVVCHGERDQLSSWWKGPVVVMVKGTSCCHGERDQVYVTVKGTSCRHGERDQLSSWWKGPVVAMVKGTSCHHGERDQLSVMVKKVDVPTNTTIICSLHSVQLVPFTMADNGVLHIKQLDYCYIIIWLSVDEVLDEVIMWPTYFVTWPTWFVSGSQRPVHSNRMNVGIMQHPLPHLTASSTDI